MSRALIEAAVESVSQAVCAVEDGARRLELCRALFQAGLTPEVDVLRAVRAAVDRPIHVLIRVRSGDFVYTADELAAMCGEIRSARLLGADAVVVGALTRAGVVDREAMERLRDAAGAMPVVAHRAVDAARDVVAAVSTLADLEFRRVLTSGGAPTAEEGVPILRQLVAELGDRIVILAGGAVRGSNVRRIVEQTGVHEIHLAFPAHAEADRVRAVTKALAS